MKILGCVMAVIAGYIIGYLITVWVASRIESADGDYIDADEREWISGACLIWPILLPILIIVLVVCYVEAAANIIMRNVNDHRDGVNK